MPVGKAVRYEPEVGSVAVRLMTTAETPVAGTPPRPVACTSIVECGPTDECVVRVSRIRDGSRGEYRVPTRFPMTPFEYQPTTSTMTCVNPARL